MLDILYWVAATHTDIQSVKQNDQLNKMMNLMPFIQNKTLVKHFQINKCVRMLSSHEQME